MIGRNRIFGAALGLLAGAALMAPAAGQAQVADGWLPFTGCWQPLQQPTEGQPSLLCVVPSGQGVEMQSFEDGALVDTQLLVADGRERTVREDGCDSVDRLDVGLDGRWISSSSRYTCEGGASGTVEGLMALVSPSEWIHVQVVSGAEDRMTGVMRYEIASEAATEAAGHGALNAERQRALRLARIAASEPLTVEDVVAASATLDPEALSAWIVETGGGFDIDADGLVRLADAGVSEGVIDMVVATSYPEIFAIQTGGRGEMSAEQREIEQSRRGYDRFGYRGYRGWFGWSPYGYWDYSPYGYGYYGGGYGYYGGYGYWGYRPTVVVVDPTPSSGSRGRVVRGRGYTRSSGSAGGGGQVSRPSGSGSGSAAGSSGSSGSSSSTGRKAKPRGG
ncbi:MAG: hypothetical protein R3E10_10655 [Gemmatimonadota bacterium]